MQCITTFFGDMCFRINSGGYFGKLTQKDAPFWAVFWGKRANSAKNNAPTPSTLAGSNQPITREITQDQSDCRIMGKRKATGTRAGMDTSFERVQHLLLQKKVELFSGWFKSAARS